VHVQNWVSTELPKLPPSTLSQWRSGRKPGSIISQSMKITLASLKSLTDFPNCKHRPNVHDLSRLIEVSILKHLRDAG